MPAKGGDDARSPGDKDRREGVVLSLVPVIGLVGTWHCKLLQPTDAPGPLEGETITPRDLLAAAAAVVDGVGLAVHRIGAGG